MSSERRRDNVRPYSLVVLTDANSDDVYHICAALPTDDRRVFCDNGRRDDD